VNEVLYDRVNYSQITKVYGKHEEGRERYSPADFVTVEKAAIHGTPDLAHASTSHIERKNGSLRQWCKRLTRLTYAFSKKWDNLQAALALHFAYYNFVRIHGSLRITPRDGCGDCGSCLDARGTDLMTIKIHILGNEPSPEVQCADGLSKEQIIECAERGLTEDQRSRWTAIYVYPIGSEQPTVILNASFPR
jgi:hypothetical protein